MKAKKPQSAFTRLERERAAKVRSIVSRLGEDPTYEQIRVAAAAEGINLDESPKERRRRIASRVRTETQPPTPVGATDEEVFAVVQRLGPKEANIVNVCAALYRDGREDATLEQLQRVRLVAFPLAAEAQGGGAA